MDIVTLLGIAALVFGFGMVIFIHEMGHFLAAKWVGVRVEQFAVGIGPAIMSFRKGLGWRLGSTRSEYEALTDACLQQDGIRPAGCDGRYSEYQRSQAAARMGISETEYRWSWLPIGGYVKPTGQDDLRPNAEVARDDPHSFGAKSVGARMLIISAGVVMNVILAAVLFMVVFIIGFRVPPPLVGFVQPYSPAQEAGLLVGDRILYFDGRRQHDYTKLQLNVVLSRPKGSVPVIVRRGDSQQELWLEPRKDPASGLGFLAIGVDRAYDLAGNPRLDPAQIDPQKMLRPDEIVVAVDGRPIRFTDFAEFDRLLNQSFGRPLVLSVRGRDGAERQLSVQPEFADFFGSQPFQIAGLQPATRVLNVDEKSPAATHLQKGDLILGVGAAGRPVRPVGLEDFKAEIFRSGRANEPIRIQYQRAEDPPTTTEPVLPDLKLPGGHRGLGISLRWAVENTTIAAVSADSPAAAAGITGGRIVSINSTPIQSWYDIHRELARGGAGEYVLLIASLDGSTSRHTLVLDERQAADVRAIRYTAAFGQRERIEPRQTSNPLTAAAWGVVETRDLLRGFYVTLRRLTQGTVSPTNLMGPIGIFHSGTFFAGRGPDWLIWFLAMISANLAVVNFLPIPIVDGGLFVFLVLEKIQGRPLSPRAQNAAQYVGLAIILSIFVFVTYGDIARLLNMG
jgi:regulator of sigma E protease